MMGDVSIVVGGDVERPGPRQRSLPPTYITADASAIIVLTIMVQGLLGHHGETRYPDVLGSLHVQSSPRPVRLVAAMTARLPSPRPGRLLGVTPSKVPMGQSHPPRSPDITPYFSPVPRPAAFTSLLVSLAARPS